MLWNTKDFQGCKNVDVMIINLREIHLEFFAMKAIQNMRHLIV